MLKLRDFRIAAVVVALSTFGFRCVAQPASGWVYLGDAHVDGAVDHDTIKVTGARGQFRAIRMQVQYGAIEFHRVIIHYGDGVSARVPVRARISAGRQTRAIPLRGGARTIHSVEFWYARGNWGNPARPKVTLLGLH